MSTVGLVPDPPSFGCVSAGFVYRIRLYLSNLGQELDRYRLSVSTNNDDDPNIVTCDYKLTRLAPGVGVYFNLDLRAVECHQTSYTIVINKESTKISETKIVSALVIPRDVFKKVAKSLMLRNRGIYATGVKCIGQLSGDWSCPSIVSGAPTIYSEALIDDEELDELVDIPIPPQAYWNPFTRELLIDEQLCQVRTSPNWNVEKSVEETVLAWEERMAELEAQGMLTSRCLERFINERLNRSALNSASSPDNIQQMSWNSFYQKSNSDA